MEHCDGWLIRKIPWPDQAHREQHKRKPSGMYAPLHYVCIVKTETDLHVIRQHVCAPVQQRFSVRGSLKRARPEGHPVIHLQRKAGVQQQGGNKKLICMPSDSMFVSVASVQQHFSVCGSLRRARPEGHPVIRLQWKAGVQQQGCSKSSPRGAPP